RVRCILVRHRQQRAHRRRLDRVVSRLAIHATVYRAALRFFGDWYASVRAQTDQDFDVWISLDDVTEREVFAVIGEPAHVTWRMAPPNATPSAVRQDALAAMVDAYDGIVAADIDDVMLPSRVAASRASLDDADITACALDVIDESGRELGVKFVPPADLRLDTMLPRWNVFGFSNVVWRTDMLRRCLPIPASCRLFDWLLTTRAWSLTGRRACAIASTAPTPRPCCRRSASSRCETPRRACSLTTIACSTVRGSSSNRIAARSPPRATAVACSRRRLRLPNDSPRTCARSTAFPRATSGGGAWPTRSSNIYGKAEHRRPL